MGIDYDFVVGGGSVAGLTFASEAARKGMSVLVIEEHDEIGEPEKCDGLVSLRGLRKYGHPPQERAIQNHILSAVVHSPQGRRLPVNASSLEVVVLDRSEYDRELMEEAREAGAEVRAGVRVASASEAGGRVAVEAKGATVTCRYYVDATGPASSPRRGILPAAKYEVEGDWVRSRTVEVFLDASRYPGFFAWVIPTGRGAAKVGAAGMGINPFRALDAFLADRPCKLIRRVSAPIYVGGPAPQFVRGRTIAVGESAGQVKPSTAGGIMTSVAGAVMAARWASEAVKTGRGSLLANYRRDWNSAFDRELRVMAGLRSAFERLDNSDMEALMDTLATPRLILRLSQADFDFHATAFLGALGLPGIFGVAKVVAVSGLRSLAGRR